MDTETILHGTTDEESAKWDASPWLEHISNILEAIEDEVMIPMMLIDLSMRLVHEGYTYDTFDTFCVSDYPPLFKVFMWTFKDDSRLVYGLDEDGQFNAGALPPNCKYFDAPPVPPTSSLH